MNLRSPTSHVLTVTYTLTHSPVFTLTLGHIASGSVLCQNQKLQFAQPCRSQHRKPWLQTAGSQREPRARALTWSWWHQHSGQREEPPGPRVQNLGSGLLHRGTSPCLPAWLLWAREVDGLLHKTSGLRGSTRFLSSFTASLGKFPYVHVASAFSPVKNRCLWAAVLEKTLDSPLD